MKPRNINFIISFHIVLYFCKLCWDIIIYQNSHPRSLFAPSLSLSLSLSNLFVGLRIIGKLDSYSFSHHALIRWHAAWLTRSWSACTELLITGTPHLSHQAHTHIHANQTFLHGRGSCKAFPLTAVCWHILQKRQDKEGLFFLTVIILQLFLQ